MTKMLHEIELPYNRREDLLGKIMARVIVHPVTNCWEWQGGTSGNGKGGGYGRIWLEGTTAAVHIVIYTLFYGWIPNRKQVDHTCNNRICCNPVHLELVTHKVNQERRAQRAKEKLQCQEVKLAA